MYPTPEQEKLLRENLGCCRFVSNQCIEYAEYRHTEGLTYPGYYGPDGFASFVTGLKSVPDFSWLKAADATALQNSAKFVDMSYRNMFACRARKPRYKSKHSNRQSYTTTNNGKTIRYEDGKYIRIPKVGRIPFRGHIRNHERILSATIELTPTGKWFISLVVETDIDKRLEKRKLEHGSEITGVDLGVRNYAVLHNGKSYEHIENPKAYDRKFQKLRIEERKLSRMREHETKAMRAVKVHSRNYEKQRVKVARIHEEITNIRRDFLHKLSRRLAVENQALIVETLEVKRMLEDNDIRLLNRLIADASWGTFIRMLEYKCEETGCILYKVEEDYPSTEMCSECGYINRDITLARRTITCPVCQTTYDRDENAARNMYKRWLNAGNSPAAGTVVGGREGLSHKPVETGAAGHMSNRCLSSVVEAGISVGYAPE